MVLEIGASFNSRCVEEARSKGRKLYAVKNIPYIEDRTDFDCNMRSNGKALQGRQFNIPRYVV